MPEKNVLVLGDPIEFQDIKVGDTVTRYSLINTPNYPNPTLQVLRFTVKEICPNAFITEDNGHYTNSHNDSWYLVDRPEPLPKVGELLENVRRTNILPEGTIVESVFSGSLAKKISNTSWALGGRQDLPSELLDHQAFKIVRIGPSSEIHF